MCEAGRTWRTGLLCGDAECCGYDNERETDENTHLLSEFQVNLPHTDKNAALSNSMNTTFVVIAVVIEQAVYDRCLEN
jgi:hypothetical protein